MNSKRSLLMEGRTPRSSSSELAPSSQHGATSATQNRSATLPLRIPLLVMSVIKAAIASVCGRCARYSITSATSLLSKPKPIFACSSRSVFSASQRALQAPSLKSAFYRRPQPLLRGVRAMAASGAKLEFEAVVSYRIKHQLLALGFHAIN